MPSHNSFDEGKCLVDCWRITAINNSEFIFLPKFPIIPYKKRKLLSGSSFKFFDSSGLDKSPFVQRIGLFVFQDLLGFF